MDDNSGELKLQPSDYDIFKYHDDMSIMISLAFRKLHELECAFSQASMDRMTNALIECQRDLSLVVFYLATNKGRFSISNVGIPERDDGNKHSLKNLLNLSDKDQLPQSISNVSSLEIAKIFVSQYEHLIEGTVANTAIHNLNIPDQSKQFFILRGKLRHLNMMLSDDHALRLCGLLQSADYFSSEQPYAPIEMSINDIKLATFAIGFARALTEGYKVFEIQSVLNLDQFSLRTRLVALKEHLPLVFRHMINIVNASGKYGDKDDIINEIDDFIMNASYSDVERAKIAPLGEDTYFVKKVRQPGPLSKFSVNEWGQLYEENSRVAEMCRLLHLN